LATLFETEIREQPETLRRLLDEGRGIAEGHAAELRRCRPRFAVLAARGSSDNAARYAQYLLGIRNRLVASLATPSLFTQYGASPSLADALVIGVSQSGQSPDVVGVLREGRRQGALTLAITNDPRSPLASAAELVFPLLAGPERAVAATKTYTAQLLAIAMLSAAIEGDPAAWQELAALPGQVAGAIELNLPGVALAARFKEASGLLVVGRGYNLSTAFEIALKVAETSGVLASAYSSADLLHGPLALVERGLPVLVVAPGRRAFPDLQEVVRVAKERGAPIVAISDRPELLAAGDVALALPAGAPEWLSPVSAVVPGQLWALGLSLARGREPDAPRGLAKVTLTR
jgi:glucosamine--fructose-6-phosphate aminotransferase (isomerizing)